MPKFTVIRSPILHDGIYYALGDTIALEQLQADELAIYLSPVLDEKANNHQDLQSVITEEDVQLAEASIKDAEASEVTETSEPTKRKAKTKQK